MNKNIKIFFNYFLGPFLLIWFSFSIFRQIKNQSNFYESWIFIKDSFFSSAIVYLFFTLFLMLVNWSLEAWKWKISVQKVQDVSFLTSCKAILSGVSFAVTLPNRMGEYLGRALYMEEGKRMRMIALTVLGSISQLLVTLYFGILGLLLFGHILFKQTNSLFSSNTMLLLFALGIVSLLLLTFFYFRLRFIVQRIGRWKWTHKYSYVLEEMEKMPSKLLLQLLIISTIRYFIFLLQYYLLFQFFGVAINGWHIVGATTIMFFVMAIIPTIALFEVVQKLFVAKEIFYFLTPNLLGVGFVTTTIWMINLIIPAAIGSLLMLRGSFIKK